MSTISRWVIALVILAILVGFLAFARGREHRRGDDVGALGGSVAIASKVVIDAGG